MFKGPHLHQDPPGLFHGTMYQLQGARWFTSGVPNLISGIPWPPLEGPLASFMSTCMHVGP